MGEKKYVVLSSKFWDSSKKTMFLCGDEIMLPAKVKNAKGEMVDFLPGSNLKLVEEVEQPKKNFQGKAN